jgi:outer membrane protein assembly factor BamB
MAAKPLRQRWGCDARREASYEVISLTSAGACLAACTLAGSIAASTGSNYASYLGGPAHDSFASSATTITVANASGITSKWKDSTLGVFNASPTVKNGIIYIGSENGDFYAIKASTGKVKWTKALTISNCSNAGIVSTATVAKDPISGVLTVYVGAADHYLYALNAATGMTIWKTLIGGTSNAYYNWSSPTLANGYIYYGVGTDCGNAGADGEIALNQHTGTVTGQYYTSGSPTVNGATIYTAAAVAPDGSVFVTTGDANGASTNDSTAIVKLAGGTLTRLGGYQIPGLIGKNMDFNASPSLFNDGGTPMVGACDKNGVFYALSQSDPSSPVWTDTLGIPPASGSLAFCGGAAVYNGSDLFVGADAPRAGDPPGSEYELTPSGGQVWETALSSGPVVGDPSLDGSGVLAVPTYNSSGGKSAVYLMNAATGTILRTIHYSGPVFAQPIFADDELIVAGPTLQAYMP